MKTTSSLARWGKVLPVALAAGVVMTGCLRPRPRPPTTTMVPTTAAPTTQAPTTVAPPTTVRPPTTVHTSSTYGTTTTRPPTTRATTTTMDMGHGGHDH